MTSTPIRDDPKPASSPESVAARTPATTHRHRGSPRATDLLHDALHGAVAQRSASLTAALILAIVCFVILVTTGQSAASEAGIISRIDSVGTRLLVFSDDKGEAQIHSEGIADVTALSDVTWAFGLGAATDVSNTAIYATATGVAARQIVGDLPEPIRLITGRLPQPGEAIAGINASETLNLQGGVGTVSPSELLPTGQPGPHASRQIPVVGCFTAQAPLDSLARTVLIATEPDPELSVRYVYALATNVAVIDRLGDVLRTSLPAADPGKVTVEVPTGAAELRQVIAGDLGRSSRQTMLVVLGVGIAIIAVTTLGAVTARRREFGRRRALGATRSAIVALVLVQTAACAVIGTVVGTTAGLLVVNNSTGMLPAPGFVAGVAVLVVIVALLGSIPPAIAAALRDPMRILRVP